MAVAYFSRVPNRNSLPCKKAGMKEHEGDQEPGFL